MKGRKLTELESLLDQADRHITASTKLLDALNVAAEEAEYAHHAVLELDEAAQDVAITSSELLTAIVAAYKANGEAL